MGPDGAKVETKAKPSPGKIKKSKVDELADSLMDIYSIADSLLGDAITFSGRMYPEGLFLLKEDVAHKLAKNLIIVNESVPRLGKQAAKYTAPVLLLTTFLTDIAGKGMILYGILKAPKPGQ